MLFRYSTYSHCGVVPPLLIKEECLVNEVEWRLPPIIADEPSILWQRLDARGCISTFRRAPICVICKAHQLPGGFISQLELLARRKSKMGHPIKIGFCERGRRQAHCKTRGCGMNRTINDVGDCRDRIRIAPAYRVVRNPFNGFRDDAARGANLNHISFRLCRPTTRHRHQVDPCRRRGECRFFREGHGARSFAESTRSCVIAMRDDLDQLFTNKFRSPGYRASRELLESISWIGPSQTDLRSQGSLVTTGNISSPKSFVDRYVTSFSEML